MLDKSILLAVTSLCVILVWLIRLKYPDYFQKNPLVAPIVTVLIVLAAIMIYKKMCESSSCLSPKYGGAPGSCELDVDCNGANKGGICLKYFNPNTGVSTCKCKCNVGWSGANCDTKGIPWNSPNCMGNNKQPAQKDKDGMCVCPNENWASVQDPILGLVQCGKCAGDWGPYSGTGAAEACTAKWNTIDLASNNCYSDNALPTSTCDASNFPSYYKYTGPNNAAPSGVVKTACDDSYESCRCRVPGQQPLASRGICAITGWVNPSAKGVQACSDINTERQCSSYNCVNN